MGYFIIWLIFGIFAACIARSKGRSFIGWFFYGLFLGVITLIHSIVIKDNNISNERQTLSGVSQKKCPKCSEYVRSDASICHYCVYSFTTTTANYTSSYTQPTVNNLSGII